MTESTETLRDMVNSIANDATNGECFMGCPDQGACQDHGECEHQEALETLKIVHAQGGFCGVILVLAAGGPHIELNTRDMEVTGYWYGNRTTASLSAEIAYDIASAWEDAF